MDNMDVEVVVRGLVVHVQLQLVLLDGRVHLGGCFEELGLHVSEPGDVLFAEISQAPDVSSFDQPEEV